MKNKLILTAVRMLLIGGSVGSASPLLADTLTWDTDLVTPGAQDGSGAWTTTTTNFWATAAAANQTPVNATDSLVIGNGVDGFTATIDNAGALLDYSGSTLSFNNSYTLAGLTPTDGINVADMTIVDGKTVTISAQIGSTGAVKMWNVGAGAVLNLSGGGQLQNINGAPSSGVGAVVNITNGNWTTASGTTLNQGGGATILNVNQTGGTITASAGFKIGGGVASASSAQTSATYVLNGGTLNTGAFFSIGSGNTGFAGNSTFTLHSGAVNGGSSEIRIGNDGGNGVLNVQGGTFATTNRMVIARRPNGSVPVTSAVNISGGVVSLGSDGVNFGATGQSYVAGSSATLNITGGALYTAGLLVAGGTAIPNLATNVNLGGGTLAATSPFASSSAIKFTGINGNATLKAENQSGVGENITLGGVLSGPGGFTKTGAGVLSLTNSANTYSGGTLVAAGAMSASSLGTGNVEVADGASLTLNLLTAIGSSAILTLDGATSTVTLNFTGSDQIAGLVINGVVFGPGTYDVTALGSQFTGTGSLTVVPEPSIDSLLGVACLGAMLCLRRRRSATPEKRAVMQRC